MFEEKLNKKNQITKFNNNNKDQVIQGRNQVQSKLITNNNNNMKINPNNSPYNNNEIQNDDYINKKYKSYQLQQEKENSPKKLGIVDSKLSELNNQIESVRSEHLKIVETKKGNEKRIRKTYKKFKIRYGKFL